MFFSGAIVVFFGLIPSPKDVGLADPDAEHKDEDAASDLEGNIFFCNFLINQYLSRKYRTTFNTTGKTDRFFSSIIFTRSNYGRIFLNFK